MFRNVISSLNGVAGGGGGGVSEAGAGRREEPQADAAEACERAQKKGRRGVGGKRFSSMMSKIHRVASLGAGGMRSPRAELASGGADSSDSEAEAEEEEQDERGASRHREEEEEEEAYKTAEEACRKMSLNEPSSGVPGRRYDAQAGKRAIVEGLKQTQQQQQQQRRPSLAGSEKFLLPEELSDIPTFLHTQNCDRQLIEETRRLLKERYAKNPDSFYDADYERMLTDDWTVSRFLLRRRLDPRRTAKLMEECGRFRRQYKMSEVELWEFPIEFHQAGGLFQYAPDRVGNVTMYMRVKMYRRVPEISDVFKAFILCVLERCDVANGGRGTAVIFDLTGCGLQNVDLGFLSWLLSSFRNYCPKGVSYIVVYNLPWILNATCKLAMTWMSASNKRALRFVYGAEIENFIASEHLPDYMGGQCKQNYRRVPAGALPATQVCHRFDLTPEQALKIADLFKEYLNEADGGGVEYEVEDAATQAERLRRQQAKIDRSPPDSKGAAAAAAATATAKATKTTTKTKASKAKGAKSKLSDAAGAAKRRPSESALATSAPQADPPADQALELVSQATKFVAH